MWRVIFIVWISLSHLCSLFSQDLATVRTLADQAYQRQDYDQALAYLKRLSFFGEQAEAIVYFRQGECYLARKQFARASLAFDRSFFLADDTLRNAAQFGKIRSLLKSGQFRPALIEIYAFSSPADSLVRRLAFYEGLCHYALADFGRAEAAFLRAAPPNDTTLKNKIKALLRNEDRLYQPREKTAKIFSYALPGAGQFYAGDWKNGLNSLLLNAGLLAAGIYIGQTYSYLDALIAVGPWLQRYWLGGATAAGNIALKEREERRRKVYSELMEAYREALKEP